MDYFELLSLAKNYGIDKNLLRKNYLLAQAKYHPDKAVNQQQRKEYLDLSMQINEAFKTLEDDYLRAEYLLGIHGVIINEEILKTSLVPEELESFFGYFEQVQSVTNNIELKTLLEDLNKQKTELSAKINQKFIEQKYDSSLDLIAKLKYLTNLVGYIKAKMKDANS